MEQGWRLIDGSISIDRILAFAFGFVFVIILLILAVAIPNPTESTLFIFRVVLCLAAAGIGAVLPGLFEINLPGVRAGGALALAAAVFFMNPPALLKSSVEEKARSALENAYSFINWGNIELARDDIDRTKGDFNPEPVDVPFYLG